MKTLCKIRLTAVPFSVPFLFVLCLALPVYATTYFYVDTDWSGSTTGAASTPWNSLTSSAWTTINNALTTDDVTIYFSARKAESDTDQLYDREHDSTQDDIYLTHKTPDPGHMLTLDGMSYYNSNHTSPSWSTYFGSSRAKVNSFTTQNASHTKYNDMTIDGFKIETTTGKKAIAICGDRFTVKNCDISHTSTATDGPLVYVVPTADSQHEGSSYYCAACDGITISNNNIHDSYGELIYVGGGGCSQTDSTGESYCYGMFSHTNISITGNKIYNGGRWGGQGDGIDCKAGLTNVTISGNDIETDDANVRAIVTQGQTFSGPNQNYLIEKNYIHDCGNIEDAAIAIVNSWGTPKGIEIRNNIIDSNHSGNGIKIYDGSDLEIYNNTIYGNDSYAISISNGSVVLKNNLLISNNSGGPQVSLAGTITSMHNGYSNTWGGGTCEDCVAGLSALDLSDAPNGNFSLPNGSGATDKGMSLTGFSDDFVGSARGQGLAWDIGGYEYEENDLVPPAAPTNLEIVGAN